MYVGDEAALGHVLQHVDAPAELHAVLHAPAVAEALLAVMIIEHLAAHLGHAHLPGCMLLLGTLGIAEHFVASPAQAEQRQVLHHHHHARRRHGFAHILTERDAQHALPIQAVYGIRHGHFLVEVGVAFPALRNTVTGEGQQQEDRNGGEPLAFLVSRDGFATYGTKGTEQEGQAYGVVGITVFGAVGLSILERRHGGEPGFFQLHLAVELPHHDEGNKAY